MGSGLFSPSAWITPLGFLRSERENESEVSQGFEGDLVGLVGTYAILIALDVVTLPLALFWAAGVGRDTDPGDASR
jgi:hypothetical protein